MTASRATRVYLEVGARRTFACAADWPGWCRSGRGRDEALDALTAYAPRYARAAARAGLAEPAPSAAELEVVETVSGGAVTDFGAPGVPAALDREPLDRGSAARLVALVGAAWEELEAVAATSPAELTRGPRGGGRDRDAMVAHVVDAERSYARRIGVRLDAGEWRDGGAALLRRRIREALARARGAPGEEERRWPPRYLARRIAWHALDHAWEMEDRTPRPG